MAEIRINATGGLKLYDADDSHYAQILAGTISSNVDALTLGSSSATFGLPVTVGEDDTGHDVKLFGATASRYWLWDESADGVVQRGTLTVGVDDTGHDVKLFGASAGAYMEWDESEDQLRIMGASADATTSTGKLLLATSLTDINANDVIGKIEFQAPHEAGGTDAITVAASIKAVAQATFTSSVNATDLIFYTGHSEAAAEKIRITSQNEIGIAGANYGTDGQVLTSGGAGAAVAWEDAGGGDLSFGGDTFGADKTIGSNDGYALTFETNNTARIVISANGEVTMPTQSSFNAYQNGNTSNLAAPDHNHWMAADTEVWDTNGDYDTSNYVFTAPVTGKYLFDQHWYLQQIDTGATAYTLYIYTSNVTGRQVHLAYTGRWAGDHNGQLEGCAVVDMDASDTAKARIYQDAGTAQTDIVGGSSNTWWSGTLLH